jgi:AcrR family transcriptional regulator
MTGLDSGRANQKRRTRAMIVSAGRELVSSGAAVTMPAVAKAAGVSEATAYRYFPDLTSLLGEVLSGLWHSPTETLDAATDSVDPVERVGVATGILLREVLAYQGAVRATIAATITAPRAERIRPGRRFELIDRALDPVAGAFPDADALARLKLDLAVVMSAEAVLTLVDLCGLAPDDALASATRTARTLTAAALGASSR